MLHPLDSTQLIWTWIAGILFGLLFVGFARSFIVTRKRIAASKSWIKVTGEIIQSEVKLPQTHTSDDNDDARPVIRYRYRAGGEDIEGHRLALGAGGPMARVFAEQLVAKYPLGTHVDVYYDPQDTAQSALDPKSKDNVVTDAAFALVFGAIAFVLLGQGVLRGVPYLPSGLPMFMLLMPVATFVIAAFCVVVYRLDRHEARASTRWPTTAGEITTSAVAEEQVEHQDDDGGRRFFKRYRADIRYAYRVDARDYVGTTWKRGLMSLSASPGPATATIGRYPKGQRVTVHYDPADPQTAVLETHNGRAPIIVLVFGGLWAAAGALFLAMFVYLPWTQG
jgi:hypothetical protein